MGLGFKFEVWVHGVQGAGFRALLAQVMLWGHQLCSMLGKGRHMWQMLFGSFLLNGLYEGYFAKMPSPAKQKRTAFAEGVAGTPPMKH